MRVFRISPLVLFQPVEARGTDNRTKSIELEILRQNVDVPVGMYGHRLGIVWNVWIPHANSISDLYFSWKIGVLFNNNDLNFFSDAIVISNIADKQAVGRRVTRPDGKIFSILWLKSRHIDCARVAAHAVCYEKPPSNVRVVDVIQPVRNPSGYRDATRFINLLLEQTYLRRFSPLTGKRRVGLKAEQGEKKGDNLHPLQFNRKTRGTTTALG